MPNKVQFTTEEEATMRDMYLKGTACVHIGKALGYSERTIRRRLGEFGLLVIPQSWASHTPIEKIIWTAEETAALERLWDQDYSAAQIGKMLGKSRNAVVGRVYRLREMGVALRTRSVSEAGTVSRVKTTRERRMRPPKPPKMKAIKVEERKPVMVQHPVGPPVLWLNRSRFQCAYISEDEVSIYDKTCCGHPVVDEYAPYCTYHTKLCTVEAPRKPRKTKREGAMYKGRAIAPNVLFSPVFEYGMMAAAE